MRIASVDILRGIAILGILFMNIAFHGNISLGYVPFENPPMSDHIILAFNTVFSDGRFRTLFCILFGVGLAIQYQSYTKANIQALPILKKRLLWLLLFGVIHAVFIFGGDILILYSLAGLYVFKSLDKEQEDLLKSAKKLITIGCVLSLVIGIGMVIGAEYVPTVYRGSEEFMTEYNAWYGNYGYQVMVQGGFAFALLLLSIISILWQVLGLMYLGIYLYRSGFFVTGFNSVMLRKILLLAGVFTLISLIPQATLGTNAAAIDAIPLFASVSAVFVALLYAHITIKLVANIKSVLHILAAAGKVAFSLYILQSITMALVLRWLMPEFNLSATQVDYFLIAVGFTVFQVVLANIYLRFFQQGPLEALWRKLYA